MEIEEGGGTALVSFAVTGTRHPTAALERRRGLPGSVSSAIQSTLLAGSRAEQHGRGLAEER